MLDDTTTWNEKPVHEDTTTDEFGVVIIVIDVSDLQDGDLLRLNPTPDNVITVLNMTETDAKVEVILPDNGNFLIQISEAGGSRVEVPETFTGIAEIVAGDHGDTVIARNVAGQVNITGGAGDDIFLVNGSTVDLSAGGHDIIFGVGTFSGYDPDTGTEFRVSTSDIFDAFTDGDITFGDGELDLADNGSLTFEDAPDGGDDHKGSLTLNLTDTNGNTFRVTGSYSGGGTLDGSGSNTPTLYVGNADGSKSGSTEITTGSGNDTAIGGAGDVIANTGGTDEIILNNSETGGATIDQTGETTGHTVNNISGYDALKNAIVQAATNFIRQVARFVNGHLQTRFGNVVNNFLGTTNDLTSLDSRDDATDVLDASGGTDLDRILDVDLDEIIIEQNADNGLDGTDDAGLNGSTTLLTDGSSTDRNDLLEKAMQLRTRK